MAESASDRDRRSKPKRSPARKGERSPQTNRTTTQMNIPDFDDADFNQQVTQIEESDKATMLSLQAAIEEMNPNETMAAAVLALNSYDKTPLNPLEITIDGNGLDSALSLIEKLSPIAKIEFARYVLDEKEDNWIDIGIDQQEAEPTDSNGFVPIPF